MNRENQAKALLDQISALDFVLYETALYLDGHPGATAALSYYREQAKERDRLLSEYEASYGSIRQGVADGARRWSWVERPWPWEIGYPASGETIAMAKGEE